MGTTVDRPMSEAAATACEKIKSGKKDVKGQKERAVADAVIEALCGFCAQSAVFAEAVNGTGKCLAECLAEIMRGVGTSISDIEVYRRAVAFWMPGAEIAVTMVVVPAAEGENAGRAEKPTAAKPVILTLEDLW